MAAPPPHPTAVSRSGSFAACGNCGSKLVQAQGWKELPYDRVLLHLRCPECEILMVANLCQAEVAALDDDMVQARETLLRAYDLIVRENMGELADRFEVALARDLIGPDDFARSASVPLGA
jgi:hypothetical protein